MKHYLIRWPNKAISFATANNCQQVVSLILEMDEDTYISKCKYREIPVKPALISLDDKRKFGAGRWKRD